MARSFILLALAALPAGASAPKIKLIDADYHLVPGSVPLDKGPDGNSIFLGAPKGLVLVDTGRHPEHAGKLLAYARQRDAAPFIDEAHRDYVRQAAAYYLDTRLRSATDEQQKYCGPSRA